MSERGSPPGRERPPRAKGRPSDSQGSDVGSQATSRPAGTVIPLRSLQSDQARRRYVEAQLRDARAWIDAGIDGRVDLAGAVVEAFIAVNRAHAEVLRAPLEEVAS